MKLLCSQEEADVDPWGDRQGAGEGWAEGVGACAVGKRVVGPGGKLPGFKSQPVPAGTLTALEPGQVSSFSFLICKVDVTRVLATRSCHEYKLSS